MNTLELLYNKALIKAAAEEDQNIKKSKVWFGILIWYNLLHLMESRDCNADISWEEIV
jgi:hypothetical protein